MENKEHESQMQFFEGRKVRTLWDEEAQEWFFSVVDVVAVLTESADPKQYIKKMRSRDPELNSRWGTICTPTRMMASDGKCYNTQAADMLVCDNNRQSQLNKHCKMRRSRRVGG